MTNRGFERLWTILMWVYIIGGYIACIVLIGKTGLQAWLPTYLHIRFSLHTKVTCEEAKRLDFLFNGSLGGAWQPLESIRNMDEKIRKDTLFIFANKVASENGLRSRFKVINEKHTE